MQLFMEKLAEISPKLAEDLEIEELILYSHVKERIDKHKLQYYTGYHPNNVPPEQI